MENLDLSAFYGSIPAYGISDKAALSSGLAFFAAVAILAGMVAVALGPAHPLMALWAAAPAPLVFSWLVLRRAGRRLVRIVAVAYLVVVPLVAFALWGAGWMVSGQLREGALARDTTPRKYDLEVVALGPDTLTLRVTAEAAEDGPGTLGGFWGLEGTSVYYQRVVRWERHVQTYTAFLVIASCMTCLRAILG